MWAGLHISAGFGNTTGDYQIVYQVDSLFRAPPGCHRKLTAARAETIIIQADQAFVIKRKDLHKLFELLIERCYRPGGPTVPLFQSPV